MPSITPATLVKVRGITRDLGFWLNRWRKYPLSFAIEACQAEKYGYPNHQQAEIYNAARVSRRLAIGSGHGIGKSRVLAVEIFRHLICFKRDGIPLKIPIISPTEDANTDVIWSEVGLVKSHLLPCLRDLFKKTDKGMYFNDPVEKDFWFCTPRTAQKNRAGSIHGYHGTVKYIFDEANLIEDAIYVSAMGALTGADDSILMMANPVRLKGFFYRIHQNNKTSFKKLLFSAAKNLTTETYSYPYVNPRGEIETIQRKGLVTPESIQGWIDEFGIDSPEYCARVEGRFPTNELNVIVRREWLNAAIRRSEDRLKELSPAGDLVV